MKLSQKFAATIAAASLFVACGGLLGTYKLNQALDDYASRMSIASRQKDMAGGMLVTFKSQVQEWKNTLLRGKDPAALEQHWKAFENQEQEIQALGNQLLAELADGEVRREVQQFLAAHQTMGQNYRQGLERFKASDRDPQAGDTAVAGLDRAPTALIKQAIDSLNRQAQAETEQAEQQGQQATWISLALTAVFSVLAVLGGLPLARRVTRQLGGEPEQAHAVIQAIAQGDLTVPVPVDSGDDSSLMAAMRTMRDSLSRTVRQVRQSSDHIATSAGQIASGNADLSQRTETQASSLEQTAASMEQLTSAVRQNSDTARQANQLASSASAAATKGGEVVDQVIATMEEITTSSRRIADIIGLIDGIAFQTNILALNAAVEAARAGEQGRGFAVVASEVRSLAQRSAEAAKEIKTLIGASVERVEAGSALVDDAGNRMDDIVVQVKQVTDLIGEITASSAEQSNGISQVGDAVTQLDQMTQQNAALVEESAAAAESLRQQATELTTMVSMFKIDQHEARQASGTLGSGPSSPGSRAAAPHPTSQPFDKPPAKPALQRPAPDQLATSRSEPRPASPPKIAAASTDDDWEEF
ncbi:methyl-accepting chemotaxis protein [Malikia sp.]|uniref:methyl-accepting chemotaxis protein n=1 Tax=Malikia sp. TaxID=2070706 RepID=UPI00260DFA10|nr:methyl-accepting chemotaxis protein [Malikia sp.]MDD2729260.1 methyl-accepting chemotaxis protein [Malikia sp.]